MDRFLRNINIHGLFLLMHREDNTNTAKLGLYKFPHFIICELVKNRGLKVWLILSPSEFFSLHNIH